MRLRTLGVAALLSTSLFQPSEAVIRPKGAEPPVVSADQGPRTHRTIGWTRRGALASAGLSSWTAIWDRDTDVPLRMWGDGDLVSGSIANAATAEAAARQFVATHIATLAPGSSASDFELVSNQLNGVGDVRSVGFEQRAAGVRVLGGSIGIAFKRDRIVLVSSTALPHVTVAVPTQRLAAPILERAATRWLADAGQAVAMRTVASAAPTERVIIPIVRPRLASGKSIAYRVAEQVAVEATANPGRWNVWLDAGSGAPIARKSTISYASGRILFDVPQRGPNGMRSPVGAPFVTYDVNGAASTSTIDGAITWADGNATVGLKLVGQFANVRNKAGAALTETVTLAPDGVFTWSHPTEEFNDSQIDAYIFANTAKQFAKTKLNPNLAWLNDSVQVNVNESQTCNAFSTGDDIHFFKKGGNCENTGRLADVVYHEFGHSLHANSIIPGVGQFDGGLSEGLADTLAEMITGDSGMGRGFFLNNAPLRELNPARDKRWGVDNDGEVHDDGEIIGEALWDLRTVFETKFGVEAGYDKWLVIAYAMFQRASDIPSTYAEALLADDDDGSIGNGTPNTCEINDVFGRHGLADPATVLGISTPTRDAFRVAITAVAPANAVACPNAPKVTGAFVDWKLRGGAGGTVAMNQAGDSYSGDIPAQADGSVVQYKVTVTLSDNTSISYPQNAADPLYEFYVGEVETLYCGNFEHGLDGWKVSSNDWEVGAPAGLANDPKAAFGGTNVLGLDLSSDGLYSSNTTQYAESPEIDLAGHTNVRLQYRRWLSVEDGFYDSARILANDAEVWSNFKSATDPQTGGVNHIDKEWRFQDVDLSATAAASGKLKLKFELTSDQGLEFGGWNLDDVCVVAMTNVGSTGDDAGGGCCSTGRDPEGAIALSLVTLGMLTLRRRRR